MSNEPRPHHTQPLYRHFASAVDALYRCRENSNPFAENWEARLLQYVLLMPSGSGFDNGTELLLEYPPDISVSHGERLVFETSFHHMDEHGGYSKWTEHIVVVNPSLVHGFKLRVKGRDHNDIKDYIADEFHCALSTEVTLCPKCGMPSHQCQTGDPGCLHCNECVHQFFKAKEAS